MEMHMLKFVKARVGKFLNETSGATAIEYGLIAALIALAIIAAVTAVGTDLDALFDSISAALP
jgi:pilus assembly protein Flp/PilA